MRLISAKMLSVALLVAALAACAEIRPFDHSFSNDPQGPGLFTGEAGAFVLAVPQRLPRASDAPATEPKR